MTLRKSLVLGDDGLPQQLQPGDTISAPTNTPSIRAVANADTAQMVFGMAVYASGADAAKRAQANAKATAGVIALVYDATIAAGATGQIADNGVMVGTTAQWDAVVAGQSGGLTFNSLYFLDIANPGKLTTAPPTTAGSGQCNALVGRAMSTTELALNIRDPILL